MRIEKINAARAVQLYARWRNWKIVGEKLALEERRPIKYHSASVAKAVARSRRREVCA